MMRSLLMVLCLSATIFALPTAQLSDEAVEGLWQQFVTEHKKVYHPHEVSMRFQIFKDNLDFVNRHNADETQTYKVAINKFADITSSEFKKLYLGYNMANKKPQQNVVVLPPSNVDAIDWVEKGAVTPVKDQGQCGSCWAFSTVGGLEGVNAIQTGKLLSFSEQELVSCASSFGNQGCNGGLMDDAFKYVEKDGDALESQYPYTGTTGSCQKSKTTPSAVSITGFVDVTVNSEAQLEAAVTIGPVSVAIEADQSGFQMYSSGVFSGTCGTSLDHGVTLVGFGVEGGKNYWKVKNSWGESWGLKGYILLAKDIKETHGQCGIAMSASYPTMGPAPPPTPTPPTPTPTPPTPTPTPPTPSGDYYEDPPCKSDEIAVTIEGVPGTFCSPACDGTSASCKAVPTGVTGKAECVLEMSGKTTPTQCAIICNPGHVGAKHCPTGATCQSIQGTGLCTYPASSKIQTFTAKLMNKPKVEILAL